MKTEFAQPKILVTLGDPDGIGPEVALKAWRLLSREKLDLLFIGAAQPLRRLRAPFSRFPLLPAPPKLGPGAQAGWSIQTAVSLILAGKADALATGPISKERLNAGGYLFPGHTEMLSHLCGDLPSTMMLANDRLRVSLVTIHIALKSVPKRITGPEIERAVRQTIDGLRTLWGISKPRIAVTGLNPHSGENGVMGDEENGWINSTVARLAARYRSRATIVGPLPADTLFALHFGKDPKKQWDAVVCMYHDQGLIPVKMVDFARTVNVTLGLPVIRTSVDHGVAFDLVGKNKADPSSMVEAIRLANRFALERRLAKKRD